MTQLGEEAARGCSGFVPHVSILDGRGSKLKNNFDTCYIGL